MDSLQDSLNAKVLFFLIMGIIDGDHIFNGVHFDHRSAISPVALCSGRYYKERFPVLLNENSVANSSVLFSTNRNSYLFSDR